MSQQKKSRNIMIVAAVIFAFAALGLIFNAILSNDEPPTTEVTFTAVANKTVLEQLEDHSKVEVQTGVDGPYPYSIEGTESTEESIWVYYVDGERTDVPAADFTTQGGEQVEWKFESFE